MDIITTVRFPLGRGDDDVWENCGSAVGEDGDLTVYRIPSMETVAEYAAGQWRHVITTAIAP